MRSLDKVDLWTLLRFEADLTEPALDGFLDFVRGHFGLAAVVYLSPSLSRRRITDPFLALAYCDAQVENCRAAGAALSDLIAADSDFPLEWKVIPRFEENLRRLLGEAARGGAAHRALTIPVPGPGNRLEALFSVTSLDGDAEWLARRDDLERDLVCVAHYVHQCARRLHGEAPQIDVKTISAHEMEALRCVADGRSRDEVDKAMRMMSGVVSALLSSARHKLQALNEAHMVAKAIQAGLI
jgi:DNA-binding CsgD family transcriptional regulator